MRAVRLANPKSITISDEIVNKTSYLPNPDAFTMALFSRLMGPKVLRLELNVSASAGVPNATEMLRGYAHCARGGGGATLLLINLASATDFDVAVGAADAASGGRLEWHLTAPGGDIHAKAVELNGAQLALEDNNTAMPAMQGKSSAGGAVHVAAASVVFVQLPATASPSTCSASASGAALKTDEIADLTRFETQVLPRWLKNFQITAAGKPVEGAFRQKVGGPQAPYGTADVRDN